MSDAHAHSFPASFAPEGGRELPLYSEDDLHNDHDLEVRDLAEVPSTEILVRSIVTLMSAAAEKLGLSEDTPTASAHFDLDEARKLINGLAGLVKGSVEYMGPQASAVRDGLQGLQKAFREFSADPDKPGEGPGEQFTGPVY